MYADHDGAINQLLHEMDAIARVNDDLRARLAEMQAEMNGYATGYALANRRLAAVLAVPACRDAGHVETLHSAAGCCDPYETPCAAYTASMRAAARCAEECTPTGADRAEEGAPSPYRTTVQKDGAPPTENVGTDPAPRDRAGCGGVGCPCSDDCYTATEENQP